MHGRAARATDWRDASADPRDQRAPRACRLRIQRNGTASIFPAFAEPLSGFRQATARPHRTKDEWAHEVAHLLDTRYADTPRITLVCDNLNTQAERGVLRSVPSRESPRVRAADQLRVHLPSTAVGSTWPNANWSCLTSQCLSDRRIGDIATLQSEIAASGPPEQTSASNGPSTGNSLLRKPASN